METTVKSGYRLYGWKLTGSLAIEAAFAEAGAEFEFVAISRTTDENLNEDFRRINPRQQLPAVNLLDGTFIAEGPAILLHIADAFPEAGLAPKPGSYEGFAGTRDSRAVHAGKGSGGDRSSAINRRMSVKRCLGIATSAMWKAMTASGPACVETP